MIKQVIKNSRKSSNKDTIKKKRKLPRDSKGKAIRNHPKFGTSKLEEDFANDFLDKLNINYQWQFEAKDIQRFYDFYLPDSNILIEIDGDYYHANPEKYDVNNWNSLTPTQKHDIMVDNIKNKWALLHGIPIYRFWENDIRKNPSKVLNELKDIVKIYKGKQVLEEKKNRRHVNNLNKRKKKDKNES